MIVDQDSCEENVTWTLDSEGTLTISGTGMMQDYEDDQSPWYNNTKIKKIIVENGIIGIGGGLSKAWAEGWVKGWISNSAFPLSPYLSKEPRGVCIL